MQERNHGASLIRIAEVFHYARRPIRRFLDVSTGAGTLLDAAAELLPEIADTFWGIEPFPPPPQFRARHPNYRIGFLRDLDGRFDGGTCIEVIEHLPPEVLKAMVAELAALSEPGALWYFNSAQPSFVLRDDPGYLDPHSRGHVASYSVEGLRHVFAAAGFTLHALPGRDWAFLAEHGTHPLQDANALLDRVWTMLPENRDWLDSARFGPLLRAAGQEGARCYLEGAIRTWAVEENARLAEADTQLRACEAARLAAVALQQDTQARPDAVPTNAAWFMTGSLRGMMQRLRARQPPAPHPESAIPASAVATPTAPAGGWVERVGHLCSPARLQLWLARHAATQRKRASGRKPIQDADPVAHALASDIAFLFAVVVAWAAASWQWLSGRRYIPWDSIDAFFPQVAFIVSAIRGGQSPVWNPLAFGGQPVLGDPQGMIFTPHVLSGLLRFRFFGLHVFDVTTLLCVLVGGLSLYVYVRRWGAVPALAAIGAVVFMLGGFATSRLQHVPQIVSYSLLPVALLAMQHAIRRPGILAIAGVAATALLLVLNPNQVVFLAPFLLAPLIVTEVATAARPGRAAMALLAGGLLAGLLASPVLAAVLETVAHSNRVALTLADSAVASLPAHALWSSMLPGLYGILPPSRERWPPVDATESYLYLGVIPIVLLVWGMARRDAPPAVLFAAWTSAAIAFLFAMGTQGVLYPWLFETVPGFSLFRRPSDAAYFFNLHAAIAVSLTCTSGSRRSRSLPERLLIPTLACVAIALATPGLLSHAQATERLASLADSVGAFGFRLAVVVAGAAAVWHFTQAQWRPLVFGLGALGLTTADLSTTGRATLFASSYRHDDVAGMFRRLDVGLQLDSPTSRSLAALDQAGGQGWRSEIIGGDLGRLGPIAFGFPLAQGYNPLVMARYAQVFGNQRLSENPKRFTSMAQDYDAPAYRWLGLRFVLMHRYILENANSFGGFGANLLEIDRAARALGAIEIPQTGTYVLLALPHRYARAGLIGRDSGEAGPPERHCAVLAETTTRLLYQCQTPNAARLVVGDSFAPGWSACVDGRRTPIEPFLHALRAVPVPAGESVVEFRYQPIPWFRWLGSCRRS